MLRLNIFRNTSFLPSRAADASQERGGAMGLGLLLFLLYGCASPAPAPPASTEFLLTRNRDFAADQGGSYSSSDTWRCFESTATNDWVLQPGAPDAKVSVAGQRYTLFRWLYLYRADAATYEGTLRVVPLPSASGAQRQAQFAAVDEGGKEIDTWVAGDVLGQSYTAPIRLRPVVGIEARIQFSFTCLKDGLALNLGLIGASGASDLTAVEATVNCSPKVRQHIGASNATGLEQARDMVRDVAKAWYEHQDEIEKLPPVVIAASSPLTKARTEAWVDIVASRRSLEKASAVADLRSRIDGIDATMLRQGDTVFLQSAANQRIVWAHPDRNDVSVCDVSPGIPYSANPDLDTIRLNSFFLIRKHQSKSAR